MDFLQFVLAPQIVNGLTIGVAVVLVALGMTIIFGLLDVINMAHGEFYAIGAYLAVSLLALGANFWVALIVVPLCLLPIGYAVERLLIQQVFHSRDRHILTLLLTLGISIIFQDLFKLSYGPNTIRLPTPISGGSEILGVFLPNYRAFLLVAGSLIIFGAWLLVYRTSLGAMIRAAAFDKDMAGSLGVPVKRIFAGTFAFGVALAGVSGVLLAPLYSVFPTMGHDFILMAFVVVIVGGMGSLVGAVVAGLSLTQIQSISSLIIPPVWSDLLVFVIMVAVLVVRPQGLFGKLGTG
jgi:branched-chain amino acid transport system permease protein